MKTKRSKRGLTALLALCMALFVVPFSANAAGAKTTPMVSADWYHTAVLKEDGTVWSWGGNGYGRLGNGTTLGSSTPVQATGLSDVTAVSVGDAFTAALKQDGTVWTWGYNLYGQLGNGAPENGTPTPMQVKGLSGVTAISAGPGFMAALKEDGTVCAWGNNSDGQLGNGTTMDSSIPVRVKDLSGVTAIFAGSGYTVALKEDGTVWVWGENDCGQFGDGTTTDSSVPVQVTGLSGVTAISAGGGHTVALKEDGTVWTWGFNDYGQLGDDTTTKRNTPAQVTGLSSVRAISAGSCATAAVKEDGTVWTWGDNEFGQLGDDTTTKRNTPMQVIGLSGVTAVTVGANSHMVALKEDGSVLAWGLNEDGQLGNGTNTNSSTPVQVLGGNGEGALNLKTGAHTTIITATVPSPAYTVTIPTSIPVGIISKTAASNIKSTAFDVTAAGVAYLGTKRVEVSIFTTDGEFNLSDGSHYLPYKVYGTAIGGTALTDGGLFASFTADGTVTGRVDIDRANTAVAGNYTGTVTFTIALADVPA